MQPDLVSSIEAWAVAVLVYPGLLFGVLLFLLGEWLASILRPLLAHRLYRSQMRSYSLIQPLYEAFKLAGRRSVSRWQGLAGASYAHSFDLVAGYVCMLAPVLALAVMPMPGSPLATTTSGVADLFTVLALLAVQPFISALMAVRSGGLAAMQGARGLGRVLTGLVPMLVSVAALSEVSASHSTGLAGLLVAPEIAAQTVVRLLAGVVLFVALPWWSGLPGRSTAPGAGEYLGRYLQAAALAVFWAVIVLPGPGDLPWAVALLAGGALLAYAGMRVLPERWAPARRETDSARLLWATALPVAALALIVSLWPGA